jgi:hypothetical protein
MPWEGPPSRQNRRVEHTARMPETRNTFNNLTGNSLRLLQDYIKKKPTLRRNLLPLTRWYIQENLILICICPTLQPLLSTKVE